jgi:biopolymer transport protein ExbD
MSLLGKTDKSLMGEMNVTPLVDVMLVLLIVFIVTAPLLTAQSLSVTLPKTAEVSQKQENSKVNLNIEASGSLKYQDRMVTDEELTQLLRAQADNKDFRLQVAVDRTLPYERVAEIMVLAQNAGVAKMFFVTEKKRANR